MNFRSSPLQHASPIGDDEDEVCGYGFLELRRTFENVGDIVSTPDLTPFMSLKFFWKTIFLLGSIGFIADAKCQNIVIPNWANATVLQGCGSAQSNSVSGAASRVGYLTTVTTELKTAPSVQLTWGVQARDIGVGLNVLNWNPYIEIRSIHESTSTVAGITLLDINEFRNLDGSLLQVETISPTGKTFKLPEGTDYGTSSTGRTNFVFSYTLSAAELSNFQNSLVVGQTMAFFLINGTDAINGAAYTLGGPNVLANGGEQLAILNGAGTTNLPTIYPASSGAFEIHGLPSVLSPFEQWMIDNNLTDPADDADHDGFTNSDEYISGTEPKNPLSRLILTIAPGNLLQWNSVEGRVYDVYWSPDLNQSFQLLSTIPYPQNSYSDTAHALETRAFYKLGVRYPTTP